MCACTHTRAYTHSLTTHTHTHAHTLFRFNITWEIKGVREMAKAIELATRMAESSTKISQSFIPNNPEHKPLTKEPALKTLSKQRVNGEQQQAVANSA